MLIHFTLFRLPIHSSIQGVWCGAPLSARLAVIWWRVPRRVAVKPQPFLFQLFTGERHSHMIKTIPTVLGTVLSYRAGYRYYTNHLSSYCSNRLFYEEVTIIFLKLERHSVIYTYRLFTEIFSISIHSPVRRSRVHMIWKLTFKSRWWFILRLPLPVLCHRCL